MSEAGWIAEFAIRPATTDDAATIAHVQNESRRTAYRGHFPLEALEGADEAAAAERWRRNLSGLGDRLICRVATSGQQVVGFVAGGDKRDAEIDSDAEIYSLYVLSWWRGLGVGRALLRSVFAAMAEAGRRRVYLWTIADNVRTRKFYEREGGEVIAEMDRPTFAGIVKAEVAYGWSDVASTSTEGSAVLAPESDEFDVRYADFGDAADIAHIQVATWRDAYRDIMPPEQLDEMNDVRIAAFWAKVLAEADPRNFLLLAERGGHAIGFASCGPCQNPGLPNQGEIFAFYVLPAHQRRGVGRRLIREGFARLAELGMAAARIWTLRDNAPGRAFYERLGGALGGEGRTDIGGQFYTEVAYDWPDLRSWLAHA